MKQYLLFIIFLFLIFVSCKKDKGSNPGNSKKIASMSKGAETYTYTYDALGRLSRLDFHPSKWSLRFEYNGPGIVSRWYGPDDSPVTDSHTEYNIQNGRMGSFIHSETGNVTINGSYEYDGEGRLMKHTERTASEQSGVEIIANYFQYHYENDKTTRMNYANVNRGVKKDSCVVDISYYDTKKFFSYRDIGLDVFGKIPTGTAHEVVITTPSPLSNIIPAEMYPAAQAPQTRKFVNYRWGGNNHGWVYLGVEIRDNSETDYEFDTEGNLTKYAGWQIVWQ